MAESLGGRAGALVTPVYAALLLISGLLLAPLAMPILPPATFAATYGPRGRLISSAEKVLCWKASSRRLGEQG